MKQIAIVGGGIIGCTLAFRLAQAGAQVTVMDQSGIGQEASYAGAGMLAPGGEFAEDSAWARLGVESLQKWPDLIDELEMLTGISQDFRICGAIELAYSQEEAAAVQQRIARQSRLGIRVQPLQSPRHVPRGEAVCEEGLVGAWHFPDEAVVDPRPVVAALRQASAELGVEFVTNQRVQPEQPALPGFETTVWSTGAWPAPEASTASRPMPVKGHLIRYAPFAGLAVPGPILRRGHLYALQRAHGGFVVGSNEEQVGFLRPPRAEAGEQLHGEFCRILPAAQGQQFEELWAGFRPGTTLGEPIVEGHEGGRYWLNFGHFRNGILLAPANAELLIREIL